MRSVLLVIQCLTIALLFFESGYILYKWKTKIQEFLVLICLSTLINSIGYLFAIQASSLGEYLLGLKMSYFGRVWIPFSLLLFVNSLCKVKNNKYILTVLGVIHFLIFGLVATCEYHPFYFKNMYLNTEGIFPSLGFEKGVVYKLYNILILCYMVYGISLLIHTTVKEKNKIQKKRLGLVCAAIFSESVFYLIEIYGNTVGFDDTVTGYGVSSFFMFIAIVKYSLLDNLKIISDYVIDEVSEGIIVINRNKEIEYYNKPALHILPQLHNYSSEIVEKIQESIVNQKPLFIDEKVYTLKQQELTDEGIAIGKVFVITDDTEHYKALALYENYNEELTKQVEEKTKRIREIQNKTILGMAQVIESRDLNTGGHVKRTSDVVKIFSSKLLDSDLGLSKEFLEFVIRSAPMHDLGKIGVDDAILRKQGKFTDEEYELMKKHSEIGASMIDAILTGVEDEEFVKIALNVAHYHHEKVNGKGYPEGLNGEEIPMEARIMALADVFDALVSKRCYKEAFSYDKAFEIIKKDAGTHFDIALSNIFIQCREELEAYYEAEKNPIYSKDGIESVCIRGDKNETGRI